MDYDGVSTHSRLKAAGFKTEQTDDMWIVSTHSRLKAAGSASKCVRHPARCFNTQPPEGGWQAKAGKLISAVVSTHSRLKAAGKAATTGKTLDVLFQHTAA